VSALDAIADELRRPVADLVLSMAWVDGRFTDAERAAVAGAATSLGLVPLEFATHQAPRPLSEVGLESMPRSQGPLAYVSCAWIAMADGIEVPDESRLLDELRERLDLDPQRAAWLRAMARRERMQTDRMHAPRPWWREYDALTVSAARWLVSGSEQPSWLTSS
jgi:tellurite resistance protein